MPESISPADPAPWLRDIRRANSEALGSWERILDRLEQLLGESRDAGPSGLRSRMPAWTAAVAAAVEASTRLESGIRLAGARYEDAREAGIPVHRDIDLVDRASLARKRTVELAAELRGRMADVSADLDSRRPRRPRSRIFHSEAPSLLDLHV